MTAIKVYNTREVDELVFLDITASAQNRPPDFDLIDDLADECFMPLTVGGGVRTLDDVRNLLRAGADKVAINTAAVNRPELILQIAENFGSQCVVASIDARRHENERLEVFLLSGSKPTGKDPISVAREAEAMGAGEILLTSIDRDGSMNGYDVDLVRQVTSAVSIPVIASGGAGSYQDMATVLEEGKASAVAAASIFHFTQQTPKEAKHYLSEKGFAVRL
jgi:cyclase